MLDLHQYDLSNPYLYAAGLSEPVIRRARP